MSSHQLHSDTELTIAVALICEKDDSMHNAIHKFFLSDRSANEFQIAKCNLSNQPTKNWK